MQVWGGIYLNSYTSHFMYLYFVQLQTCKQAGRAMIIIWYVAGHVGHNNNKV